MATNAIVTDLNRCVGCLACMVACKAVNNVPIGSYWNKVLRIGPSLKPGATSAHDVEMYYLPVQCQHCENPECVKVCPTGASHIAEDGTVQIDKSKCIGCQFCAMACPYGVRYLNEEERVVDIRPHEKGERFEELPMDKFAEHTRAFVKVEDGCNRRCAYCVIPRARGPVRSRDEASVLEELRRLADAGYKEVVLTAISLPSYGTDSGTSLVELIEKAAEVPGIERIRLGSLDPDMLHDDDIRRMAAVKKLCPQFHLSLQSGCDKTLSAMRRPYTTAQYADIAAKLRAAFGADNVSFTTDVIVGFPGETEDDFEASMAFVTGMRFLKVHVFPYSRREGTAAYDFADQLPEHEKEARSRRMTAAVEKVRAELAHAAQGRTAQVLLETPLSSTLFTGYTKQYLPVVVNAPGHKSGEIVTVTLGEWDGKRCRAQAQ